MKWNQNNQVTAFTHIGGAKKNKRCELVDRRLQTLLLDSSIPTIYFFSFFFNEPEMNSWGIIVLLIDQGFFITAHCSSLIYFPHITLAFALFSMKFVRFHHDGSSKDAWLSLPLYVFFIGYWGFWVRCGLLFEASFWALKGFIFISIRSFMPALPLLDAASLSHPPFCFIFSVFLVYAYLSSSFPLSDIEQ